MLATGKLKKTGWEHPPFLMVFARKDGYFPESDVLVYLEVLLGMFFATEKLCPKSEANKKHKTVRPHPIDSCLLGFFVQ